MVDEGAPIDMPMGQSPKDAILANIPAFPPVVLRTLDLLSNESTDVAELVSEITSDPTLSAQVLRLANSAVFGLNREIDTVKHATTLLGLSRVQSLIMTVATTNYMRGALQTEALAKCWKHTIATAVIARELARSADLPADRAYSIGLLHDIGRLALLVKFPDTYQEILRDADRDAVSLLDLEQQRFGSDHCEAGRLLVEHWKLPPDFCIAAGRHHDPAEPGPMDMLKVVHLACNLSDALGYSVVVPLVQRSWAELRELLPPQAAEKFPDDPELIRQLVDAAVSGGADLSEPPPPAVPASGRTLSPLLAGTYGNPAPSDAARDTVRDCAIVLISAAMVVILTMAIAQWWTW